MEAQLEWIIMLAVTALIGALLLLLPRLSRRGLLFGVYVGEEASQGDEARRIKSGWYRTVASALGLSLLAGLALWRWWPSPEIAGAPPILLIVGYLVAYLRAYSQARRMGVTSAPAAAAASLMAESSADLRLPILSLAVGVAGGVAALAYTASHYGEMPERIPTHFGFSGQPDSWSQRSFWTVMLLPIMTLVMGAMIGVVACLTARAKRALRHPDGGSSLAAQLRFRRSISNFLALLGLITAAMMTLLSISAVRVGTGLASAIHPGVMVLTGVLLVYALGGSLYLALRLGQGGARLERAPAGAALTNGLADNRHWVLGALYINRDDPSYIVERRFGFGYTINLGNWKAVAIFAVFIGLILALSLVAALSARP